MSRSSDNSAGLIHFHRYIKKVWKSNEEEHTTSLDVQTSYSFYSQCQVTRTENIILLGGMIYMCDSFYLLGKAFHRSS